MLVHQFADLDHVVFEHAVRRRVSDHDRGEVLAMFFALRLQVVDVDIAAFRGADDDDLHPRHLRRGRVGAVRRGRDHADIAVALAAAFVVRLDREQARIFTLRARVGLQRDRVVAGAGAKHLFELDDQLLVTLRLVQRHERVNAAESGPGYRNQLGCRVQLHRTGTERNHRAVQRQVLVRELAHVAHQVGLGVVAVEHRVGQVVAVAHQ